VNLPDKIFLFPGIVSFDRHINYGIIFSLNFPMLPVIIVSAVFMAVILVLLIKSFLSPPSEGGARGGLGWLLILAGALSNFADRVMYLGTVDYINILDRSLVNLADGMILAGIIVLLTKIKDKKELKKEQIIE